MMPIRKSQDDNAVSIPVNKVSLEGDLHIPSVAEGIVVFAHGSGSSRFSARNRYVAGELQESGLATLLFDLLTRKEEEVDQRTRHLRFDIDLLAHRLVAATDWLAEQPSTRGLKVGYFGASTGAAAALIAAAERPTIVKAIVSRGGRPDLARNALASVEAPTRLIVGGNDQQVIDLNRVALQQLRCPALIQIVPNATHLFEEAGKLEQVARLARDWFLHYL